MQWHRQFAALTLVARHKERHSGLLKNSILNPWRFSYADNISWSFSLGASSFSALTLLVWWQEWHPACKKLGVGLLVVMIWLEFCTFIALLVTAICIILSSSKIQNGDILVQANLGCPAKWPWNEGWLSHLDKMSWPWWLWKNSQLTKANIVWC